MTELNKAIAEYLEFKRYIEEEAEFPNSFRELIDSAAEKHPNKLALNFFDQGETLTFMALRNATYQLADGLSQQGVGKGTHVAVMLTNRIEFPVTWLALAVLGAVMVPVNPGYTSSELDYLLNDSDTEYAVVEDTLLPLIEGMTQRPEALTNDRLFVVGENTGSHKTWVDLLALGSVDFVPNEIVGAGDLLNIQYTSGTTGFPKGCMQTQRYWLLLGGVAAYGQTQGGTESDIKSILADSPFFYMDPQWMLVMGLNLGASVHCPERPSVKRYMRWVKDYQIELAYLPLPLLMQPPEEGEEKCALKKVMGYGLNADMTRLVEARFGVIARDAYGMTEIGPGVVVPENMETDAALNSCGMVTPFREVKVVDEEGKEVPAGVKGELWVKGDGVIQGYYNKPEANASSFVDGWFRTGDVFVADEHGFYTIVGRIKDMIRRSSENIAALEVETALHYLQSGIEDVAVVPVPDDIRGEEVKAYLLLSEGMTKDDLPPAVVIDHCKSRLAAFKVPRYLEYVDSLPYTPSEKVAKHKLIAAKEDLREGSWDEQEQRWR